MDNETELEAIDQPVEEQPASPVKWWIILVLGIVIIGLIVTAIVFLAQAEAGVTSRVRDIFIILMAFESIVIGAALVVLVVQVSTLVNLVKNEVRPILNSTKETVDTLKGTTEFLSSNLIEPVIKLNGYFAGIKQLFDLFKLKRK